MFITNFIKMWNTTSSFNKKGYLYIMKSVPIINAYYISAQDTIWNVKKTRHKTALTAYVHDSLQMIWLAIWWGEML